MSGFPVRGFDTKLAVRNEPIAYSDNGVNILYCHENGVFYRWVPGNALPDDDDLVLGSVHDASGKYVGKRFDVGTSEHGHSAMIVELMSDSLVKFAEFAMPVLDKLSERLAELIDEVKKTSKQVDALHGFFVEMNDEVDPVASTEPAPPVEPALATLPAEPLATNPATPEAKIETEETKKAKKKSS